MEQSATNMDFISMMVIMPAFFLACVYGVRGLTRYYLQRKAMAIQAEFQSKLLDKFGTSPELLNYLQSDAGTRSLQVPALERSNPYSRILGAVQTGIILGTLGAAFLFLEGRVAGGGEGFVIVGALGLALGVGFLASGMVAYTLSKSWGLINGRKEESPLDV
jgi:hypothetical protein